MNKGIIRYPNKVLKKKSKEIKKITPEIKELTLDMEETMVKNEGIGLAAPQIGSLKRMIVIQVNKEPAVFINPKIVKKSKEKEIMEEGCLSFPGVFLEIKRPRKIEVEALTLNGEKVLFETEGLLSRVFQHEIDHLDGILLIDRINFWQRWKLRLPKYF